jgi:hypothetical protein
MVPHLLERLVRSKDSPIAGSVAGVEAAVEDEDGATLGPIELYVFIALERRVVDNN